MRSTRARSSTSRTRCVSSSRSPALSPHRRLTRHDNTPLLSARLCRRLAAHPALDARDEVAVQVDPDGRCALRRQRRRLARLHGDRDAPGPELQLLGRLLEPGVHPLRVRLPLSSPRRGRHGPDPRTAHQVPRRLPSLLRRNPGRDVAQPQELAARPAPSALHPPRGPDLQPERRRVGRHHEADRAQGDEDEHDGRGQEACVLWWGRVGGTEGQEGAVCAGARLGD